MKNNSGQSSGVVSVLILLLIVGVSVIGLIVFQEFNYQKPHDYSPSASYQPIETSYEPVESSGEHIYVILYFANIDGSASPIWYHFYDRATRYFEQIRIPVLFSFFPATIENDDRFGGIFKRMYLADNIELAQKGFRMDEAEREMYKFSVEKQKEIILAGRNYYIDEMKDILGTDNIAIPRTYVAPFSSFSESTRAALEELGFKTNFGLYYRDEIGPVGGTNNIKSLQYGVSFTTTGSVGRELEFKQPDEIIYQLKHYERNDVEILRFHGDKVIPLFVHQPDFEDPVTNGKIDEEKWKIYTETISRLLKDPDVTFISPSQMG